MKNDSLRILRGRDIVLSGGLKMRHPKLLDIEKIGEEVYSDLIRIFCYNPFDAIEILYEHNIDFESITEYELFNLLFPGQFYHDADFRKAFDLFFYLEGFLVVEDSDGKISYIDNKTNKVVINEQLFSEIKSTIKKLTGFTNAKVEKFADDFTKQMYIEDLIETREVERKQNKDNNSMITMADLIGAIILETAYTFETVWDIYMYQFHSCSRMILKREDYSNMMVGIYTGNLDPKKVNLEKIYWLNNNE